MLHNRAQKLMFHVPLAILLALSLHVTASAQFGPPPAPGGPAKPERKPEPQPKRKTEDPPPTTPAQPSQPTSFWTLVLGTFSGEGHEAAARQMLGNIPRVAPQINGARVYTSPKGSMVIFGQYPSRDDANAKADLERIKSITKDGRQVFTRVILTRIDLRLTQGNLHPNDLLSARRKHPNVDPLYTLDIAIWMSNPEDKAKDRLTFDEVKKKAEGYAAQLRMQGEEAYFYHDEVNQWSTVTVGLFDRRAVHAGSGLYSSEVEALIRKHPARLVNGERLEELISRKNPKAGTRTQTPKLVEVPSM